MLRREGVANSVTVLVLFSVIAGACGGALKTQRSGKAGRPYVEFYVKPDVVQYFIGPYDFTGQGNQGYAADFTLRDSTRSVSAVAMNFTLRADSLLPVPDSVVYLSGEQPLAIAYPPFERFYVEKKDGMVTHRYGSTISYADMKAISGPGELSVTVWTGGRPLSFQPSRRVHKMRRVVREEVIQGIEFTK